VSLTSGVNIPANPPAAGLTPGEVSQDRITWVGLSLALLPLKSPISDAKVLTGRQKPLNEIAILFAEVETKDGHRGVGFSYSKRAGGRPAPRLFVGLGGPPWGSATQSFESHSVLTLIVSTRSDALQASSSGGVRKAGRHQSNRWLALHLVSLHVSRRLRTCPS
jgi:hypothetical protein